MEKLKIIVGGYIGLFPTGGATWDYLQYPLGLKNLGHDVYYIEDTMSYPLYQSENQAWDDASESINYLRKVMEAYGFKYRWAYRDIASNQCYGITENELLNICNTADVFINISCSTFLRDEYLRIPNRILIDSDPMFTQIQYELEKAGLEYKNATTRYMLENHNYLFTFGENIGQADCRIPLLGFSWHTTRQPICLDLWKNNNSGISFTSIMNWSNRKKFIYNNEEWGQKDVEFRKFMTIPAFLKDILFEIVVNKPANKDSEFDIEKIKSYGWKVLNPKTTVADSEQYRNFIFNSAAEFSIAKETYVKSNCGWFSCRSACYLAAGKPVITQETGWSKFIPTGKGLFAFNDLESGVEAAQVVSKDLKIHSKSAITLANEYFDSDKVLGDMLKQLN